MEQILIRNLPAGTKAALHAGQATLPVGRGGGARPAHQGSGGRAVTIVDLLGTDDGADIEFDPDRLGLTARSAQL